MHIRDNIVNYLCDKEYIICSYENYVYLFNYNNLDSFNDKRIVLKIKNKTISIIGENLTIVKITKEEVLIKGLINNIEMIDDVK